MFNNHLLRYATGATGPVQIEPRFRTDNFGFGLTLRARIVSAALACGVVLFLMAAAVASAATPQQQATTPVQITYGSVVVDGLNIAYREAGNPKNPKLVLLHGFPASSHQYRNLLPALADRFHVIAPDYPGFGNSDTPDPATFAYTFDKISEVVEDFLKTKGFDHYGLFVQDYGGPVGFRIVGRHPEALDWLIIQNSNAYEVGFTAAWDGFRKALWLNRSPETEKPLAGFLTHDAIKGIYLHGAKNPELISPDNWELDYGSCNDRTRFGSISICSMTTEPMCPCIRYGRRFSASINRRPSSSGVRTTSSSPRKAAMPI